MQYMPCSPSARVITSLYPEGIATYSLAPDHSLARDLTCARERVWHLESLFLVQMSKFDISNQIRKNAIKLSHDSTSQRRLIVLDLCHF